MSVSLKSSDAQNTEDKPADHSSTSHSTAGHVWIKVNSRLIKNNGVEIRYKFKRSRVQYGPTNATAV